MIKKIPEEIKTNGKLATTIDGRLLVEKTDRSIAIRQDKGETYQLQSDVGGKRNMNMYYKEGHMMASDKNGNAISTPTDLKSDGNCFYERAK